jgi:predicted transcriptional regulator
VAVSKGEKMSKKSMHLMLSETLHKRLQAACQALAPVSGRPLPMIWAVEQAVAEWLDRQEKEETRG